MRMCILLLAVSSILLVGRSTAAERPNIILVMTDDQGYAPIGRHGHPWLRTPNLNALYDASTRFTRFLVSPTCSPTRSALMTGRHPMRNGITHTILERERLTLQATTLPQVLKPVGYTSAIFGKWHLGDEDPYQPQARGFDESFIHGAGGIGQAYNCSCADAPNNSYFDPIIRHNGKFIQTHGFCTDVFFTAALKWIEGAKDKTQPFFAYIATNAPHAPFHAPPANVERFTDRGFTRDQAGFYGMIENIDENMGRLLSALETWNLLDDTLIIFMSDNGMSGGGSGRFGKSMGTSPDGMEMLPYNANMKGIKGSPDEGGVRVPFFVRWDGHLQPGRDIEHIAAHIDLLPTLAELTGAEMPHNQVEGRSLLPLWRDAKAPWADRYLYTHCGRWPVGADPNEFQWKQFAVRNQRFRFVNNNALFDMQADPAQTTNVIEQHPDVVEKMRTAYDTWWQATVPLMVNENVPMSATRPFHEAYRTQLASEGIPDWQSSP
ncbi:MAG: arylsulfatase [Planctomycetales bacterium]|nr:arylsulfatase [Planctomycetales bacterium]